MKKILLVCLFGTFAANGQEKIWKKFVNITEVGVMSGRVRYNTDTWNNNPSQTAIDARLSPTIQMFNGFQLRPKTAVGLTVALDAYNNTILMPFAVGIRQTLVSKPNKKAQLIASLDAGYGTTLAHLDETNRVTEGGLTLNPMLGYRFPNRGGSAWLLNIGYKTQYATVNKSDSWEEFGSVERRTYNRLAFRVGFQF